ncbi:hypothetical protein HAX54_024264 [Datura stramonium]|uniref:Uncharacterized protein n=1 Tax=Datura stramonium TaxID=4076 RepID=A0ABS8S5A0_DATST|nr:hypothetical protein [Datura stramonium]
MEDDIFEWEMEEEVVGELIAGAFWKGEELEEVGELQEEQEQGWSALDRRTPCSTQRTADGALTLSSAPKDLIVVGNPSGEPPLKSANRWEDLGLHTQHLTKVLNDHLLNVKEPLWGAIYSTKMMKFCQGTKDQARAPAIAPEPSS